MIFLNAQIFYVSNHLIFGDGRGKAVIGDTLQQK